MFANQLNLFYQNLFVMHLMLKLQYHHIYQLFCSTHNNCITSILILLLIFFYFNCLQFYLYDLFIFLCHMLPIEFVPLFHQQNHHAPVKMVLHHLLHHQYLLFHAAALWTTTCFLHHQFHQSTCSAIKLMYLVIFINSTSSTT